ncbi:MAG: ribosomal-processing cysteine protease Prp [Syntrophomonadaceae bacterium]|nr:ribosomal-processing cysteine protease Prp [Syntrophomonadaceae bacterium]
MVTVSFYQTPEGRRSGFKAHGHSGFAPAGKDIVCAAVSVLAQTAVLGLCHYLGSKVDVEVKDGFLNCRARPDTGKEIEQAEIIFQTMFLGVAAIKESYSKYVEITEEVDRND